MLALPTRRLSTRGLDPDRTAVGVGRDMRISPKHAREICGAIKGRYLEDAQAYLDEVIAKKQAVPFKRHKKKVGHRRSLSGTKWAIGRYPVRASKEIKKVLENAESNAVFKGLDVTRLRVIHASTHRGRKIQGIFARAHGRTSPKIKTLSHVEVVLEEE